MGILDGKIAIITGAGQGLGEGAAHAMTQEGPVLRSGAALLKRWSESPTISIRPAPRSGDQMRREHPCRGG